MTFRAKQEARGWLSVKRSEIIRRTWQPPAEQKQAAPALTEYAAAWMAQRDLTPLTRRHYRYLLSAHVLPTLAAGCREAAVRL